MSRLIDGLKKLTLNAPAPMGFRTSREEPAKPTMQIIAGVKAGATHIKEVAGTNAVLIKADEPLDPKLAKALKEPWGVYLNDNEDTAALIASGCDFVVMSPADKVPSAPQDEKTGKVLEAESSMDDGLLRAVNDLPVDAVLITDNVDESGALVWHQLMIYRHLTAFIGKPLIVPAPADITETELKALWEAGIDGILVETEAGGDLTGIQKMAAGLKPRERKQGKPEVTLPRASRESRTAAPPDEEEEEEE